VGESKNVNEERELEKKNTRMKKCLFCIFL